MNPNSETDRGRLFRAMEWSYRQLKPFRSLVYGLVTEYAGSAYGNPERTTPKYDILVNLMAQTVDAYTMALVANRPRVSATSPHHRLRRFARQFEMAINTLITEIQLEYTLRQAVLDAFFLMGIVKLHLRESPQVRLEEDIVVNPAMPFASNVSIDNWVQDMAATKATSWQYAGDWYRIPFADLKSDVFIQEAVKKMDLRPTSKFQFGNDEERLDKIARGEMTDNDELEPMIDVCDVWIPRDRTIYTFPVDSRRPFAGNTLAIAALPWENPQYGPYQVLSFNDVPDNAVPSSPASHLAGIARIINNIARKQSRRAKKQKDVYAYNPAGAQDAEKLMRASDQQGVKVQDGSEVKILKMAGVDNNLEAYERGMIQLYDRMAGNLTAKMGLGAQAPTLGQEELIQGAVSQKEAAMQYRVVDFASAVVRGLGFMLWNDRTMTIPNSVTPPGLEDYDPIDMTWTPDRREGQILDYDLNIDVYSMPYQSPAGKFQSMLELIERVFAPAQMQMMQQGGQINYQAIAKKAAKVLNDQEFEDFVKFGGLPQEQPPGEEPGGGMSPNTTRNYVRRSVPTGGSPQAQSMAQEQAWLGGGQGGAEAPQTVGG